MKRIETLKWIIVVSMFPLVLTNCADNYAVKVVGTGKNQTTGSPGVTPENPNNPDAGLPNRTPECETTDLACTPPPKVKEPGVVTILLSLGDKDNLPVTDVDQIAARVLVETMIQYASPVENPKILAVLDSDTHGESPDDFPNLWQNLLVRYPNVTHIVEPADGLTANDLAGYDLVWFMNPGYPMSHKATHDALKNFAGGVVLSGDDMSQGVGFDNSDLTGLTFYDNGTSVTCGQNTYAIDDNLSQNSYRVSLDASYFNLLPADHLSFNYGNDIDLTKAKDGLEVLASAKGNPSDCMDERPVVVRYPKQ
jgi:hypothetical protein